MNAGGTPLPHAGGGSADGLNPNDVRIVEMPAREERVCDAMDARGRTTSMLYLGGPMFLEDGVDLPGGDGDIGVPHANMGQSINGGIDNRLWCSNGR